MANFTLDPSDLKPEFQVGEGATLDQKISTRDVTFEKLNEKAQKLVEILGQAVFYAWDRQTYKPFILPGNTQLICFRIFIRRQIFFYPLTFG